MPVTSPPKSRTRSRRSSGNDTGPAQTRIPVQRVPPTLTRRTLQHNVYDYLREGLTTGVFSPGERLTIRGIAEQIGTSIMPVREAFRRLTSEGALEPLSSGATRVPVLDLEKLQDLFEIRLSVEGLAVRLAAARISEAELEMLAEANEQLLRVSRSEDIAAQSKANERFHFSIYRGAHSAELLRFIEHLWLRMGPYLQWLLSHGKWPKRERQRAAFSHHKEILDALRARDGARAEQALRADLMTAAELVTAHAATLPKSM
jgi:DNA-binding GntR family transcriptional regulator